MSATMSSEESMTQEAMHGVYVDQIPSLRKAAAIALRTAGAIGAVYGLFNSLKDPRLALSSLAIAAGGFVVAELIDEKPDYQEE